MKPITKPLEGLRVLDLTRYLAGPYATLLLGGLGAEVIKVEPPGHGDFSRNRAPFVGPEGISTERQTPYDVGFGLAHRSRNKKSITLNLREPEGQALLRDLCKNADVVVENFSPGVLAKMGCDYETLKALNPKLILCSICGFGNDGPLSAWRAYDPIAQAMSGVMSITGFKSQPPVRCGAAIADTVAPIVAVVGVLAALLRRAVTGTGDWVDVAMLDVLAFLMPEVIEYYQGGMTDFPLGNRHPAGVPFNLFEADDGHVFIATVTDGDWRSLLGAMERLDLADDPRFINITERRLNVAPIEALVTDWVRPLKRDEVVEILQRNEVVCGPVLGLQEMLNSAQLQARGMLPSLELPTGEMIPDAIGLGLPIRFAEGQLGFDQAAPVLGASNGEVYERWLGLASGELERLRDRGII